MPYMPIFGGNKTTSDWFPKNCAPQSGPMGPKLEENHGILGPTVGQPISQTKTRLIFTDCTAVTK